MIDFRECEFDADGRLLLEVEDKKLMQFSHNQVFIGALFPKTIDFDGIYVSYKNEFADVENEISISVNVNYLSNEYYQVVIPLVQTMTKNYGSLDLWLTFRQGDAIIIVSDRITLYVKESTLYGENVIEYDFATEIANALSALSKEMADLKGEIALNGIGSPVIIKYYGTEEAGGGKIQVGTEEEIASMIIAGIVVSGDVYFQKEE
jgi:hypothetical protein